MGRHVDGGGLCLVVDASGARRWIVRVTVKGQKNKNGKPLRTDFGLGSADLVTLPQARDRALEYRRMARQGLNPRYEYTGEPPARVGKDRGSHGGSWYTINDRLIHDWQAFAGKYDAKTVHAHLVSIRGFEGFFSGLDFRKVTPKHAGQYRDHLVDLLSKPKDQGGLSGSTLRHRASHLKAFFEWARGQDGYRRLSPSIPDYFALPRSASASREKQMPKAYPTMDEAWEMVRLMPQKTALQRRDQAMVALAFISGFRAAALVALRIRHVDPDRQIVMQDAREVPAKNGKTYHARWFPRTGAFQGVFLSWLQELKGFGFQPQDALFPVEKALTTRASEAFAVAPLASSKPLQEAFAKASARLGKAYTPHAARHALKALGADMCRSHEQRKAWSMNLGHSDELITERHYAKMPQERSRELIAELSSD